QPFESRISSRIARRAPSSRRSRSRTTNESPSGGAFADERLGVMSGEVLEVVLPTHPVSHHPLYTHADFLADAALGGRGAELTGETHVVPFSPRLDDLAVPPLVDADTGGHSVDAGRSKARELATMCSLAVPAQDDLVA